METLKNIEVMRAEEEWQRAGAYSVRIQGMNRPFHISLREEFDDYDGDKSRYIVLLDDGYPIATCRFYEASPGLVSIGRVVVLEEYRGNELGRRVIEEAEKWISELGYKEIIVDSRIVAVGFYEKLGYEQIDGKVVEGEVFDTIKMRKTL